MKFCLKISLLLCLSTLISATLFLSPLFFKPELGLSLSVALFYLFIPASLLMGVPATCILIKVDIFDSKSYSLVGALVAGVYATLIVHLNNSDGYLVFGLVSSIAGCVSGLILYRLMQYFKQWLDLKSHLSK